MVRDFKRHKQFVTRIPDIPINQTLMDVLLVRTFFNGADFFHASPLMDGPNFFEV